MKNELYHENNLLQLSAMEKNDKFKRISGDVPSCLPSNRLCKLLYWTCRKIQFWLCFYDDDVEIDIEDLLSNPFNTQPPSLNELIRKTDFNKEWIMFMYRNFKQICSNGRMSLQQWRRIFQFMFPKSANTEFADRVFQAIASDKTRKHITFEELILFLHQVSECCCTYASTSSQTLPVHYSRIAKFVFLLMGPDDQEQINSDSFKDYAEAVYSLNIRSEAHNSHELFSQMHISDDHNDNNDDHDDHDDHNGTPSISFPPYFNFHTLQCFNNMDLDNDGFITVEDVKRMLTSKSDQIRLFKKAHLSHSEC